ERKSRGTAVGIRSAANDLTGNVAEPPFPPSSDTRIAWAEFGRFGPKPGAIPSFLRESLLLPFDPPQDRGRLSRAVFFPGAWTAMARKWMSWVVGGGLLLAAHDGAAEP